MPWNVSELIDLNLSLDWSMQEKLTDEKKTVLERLNQAKKSADEGTGILHDDVMKEAKQWLKRQFMPFVGSFQLTVSNFRNCLIVNSGVFKKHS